MKHTISQYYEQIKSGNASLKPYEDWIKKHKLWRRKKVYFTVNPKLNSIPPNPRTHRKYYP